MVRVRVVAVAVFSLLAAVALPAVVGAQHYTFPTPAWWPGYVPFGHQDTPQYDPTPGPATAILFSRSTGYIAGWAFACIDGSQATSITVKYEDAAGVFHPLAVTVYERLYRPDIYDAYVSSCPSVTKSEGYAIYFADPSAVPLGTVKVHIYQSWFSNTLQMTDNFTLQVAE